MFKKMKPLTHYQFEFFWKKAGNPRPMTDLDSGYQLSSWNEKGCDFNGMCKVTEAGA